MWQFLSGSDMAFAALEQRARGACVRFPDQHMPPGANPPNASIGFEIDSTSGAARLLVDRGITYPGPSEEVREWLADGQRTFDSFAELRNWLTTSLQAAFHQPARPIPDSTAESRVVGSSAPDGPPAGMETPEVADPVQRPSDHQPA
jgi:hypothetical protein